VTFRLHPRPEAEETLRLPDLDAETVRRLVLAMRQAQLEPNAAAALVRDGGADLGVRFDGRFEVGVRFEGFGAGVQQQAQRLLEVATRQGWTAERLPAARATDFWARHDQVREAAVGFRAKLSAQPTEVERVANAALGSLFPVLDRPRAVHYPTLGLGFVTGEPRPGAPLAAALAAAREALVGGSVVLHSAPTELRNTPGVWGPPAAGLPLMNSVKLRLDPGRRLAPGRFVGGI